MGEHGPSQPAGRRTRDDARPDPKTTGIGADTVRELVAQLPGTTEGMHNGHPDFRVGNRIFATLWPAENRAVLRLAHVEAHALVSTKPDTYALTSDREPFAWLSVQLGRVGIEELDELLEEAWRWRAPANLVGSYRAANADGLLGSP